MLSLWREEVQMQALLYDFYNVMEKYVQKSHHILKRWLIFGYFIPPELPKQLEDG